MMCRKSQIRDINNGLRGLWLLLECVNSRIRPGKKSGFPDEPCPRHYRMSQARRPARR